MKFSLRDESGLYYGGYMEGKPVLHRMRRKESRFDEITADLILKQVTALGYHFTKVPGEGDINPKSDNADQASITA